MLLPLRSTEFYPVLTTAEPADLDLVDVPDDLAARFVAAEAAFWQAQTEMEQYLRALRRDQTAYKHDAEIARRRIDRGRRRPYRRARPTVRSTSE